MVILPLIISSLVRRWKRAHQWDVPLLLSGLTRIVAPVVDHVGALIGRWLWNKSVHDEGDDRTCDETTNVGEERHTSIVSRGLGQRTEAVDQLEDKPEA